MRPTLSPQNALAGVVLAMLGVVAIVTARPDVPPANAFASTEYRPEGYRAWAELLEREDVSVTRFVLRPIELDARIDTLVSAQPPPGLTDSAARTAADLAALAAWVRGGGRLVYIGRNAALADAETQLLDLPYFVPDVGARPGLTGALAPLVRSLHELGANRMLLVEHSGVAELSDGNGDIVVRYPLGRGEVVAVVDPVPLSNANIAHDGNARLAYLLGRPRRVGGSLAFDDGVHGALIDRPWYRALPLGVRVALGFAALAGLLALVAGSLRTGPALRLRSAREPTSAEFVTALAALYERTRARTAAVTILARAALAVAARGPSKDDDAIDRDRLAECIEAPIAGDGDLLANAKLAYRVRKEWNYGRNGDGRRAAFAGWTRGRRRR